MSHSFRKWVFFLSLLDSRRYWFLGPIHTCYLIFIFNCLKYKGQIYPLQDLCITTCMSSYKYLSCLAINIIFWRFLICLFLGWQINKLIERVTLPSPISKMEYLWYNIGFQAPFLDCTCPLIPIFNTSIINIHFGRITISVMTNEYNYRRTNFI